LLSFFKLSLDLAASIFVILTSPILRAITKYRLSLPRLQRVMDRLGVQIRSTHYYEPTYAESDLPTNTKSARNLPGIDFNEVGQLALLSQFCYSDELKQIPLHKSRDDQFGYLNNMYSFGDAEIYYSMVRHLKPQRIIEIGSGNSTLMAQLAIAKNKAENPNYSCTQICIEPFEMAWLETTGVAVIRERVETVALSTFDVLEAGDILFVDSSHVIRPCGDVLREFAEIIPRIASDVYVQVHDIFTPFDYPEHWLRRERRLWDEQYLLESFLSFNKRFEIVCAANWLKHKHWDAFSNACPMMRNNPDQVPGAFWFKSKSEEHDDLDNLSNPRGSQRIGGCDWP
jgi:hypothetical protein